MNTHWTEIDSCIVTLCAKIDIKDYSCVSVHLRARVCVWGGGGGGGGVMECQWKSDDPESKASAQLDRATQRLQEGCH